MILNRRAALAMALLLMMLPPAMPAGAGAAVPEFWTGDRTITAPVEIGDDAYLEIAGGANVSFDNPTSIPPDIENSTPSLSVEGGILVNGTKTSPVNFTANESIKGLFDIEAYLYIVGNGTPAQFLVRNCTFSNMFVLVEDADGGFSDCVFRNCDVRMHDSAGAVRNCSFWNSTLDVKTIHSGNVTLVKGCIFESNQSPLTPYGPAISARGNVRIDNCSMSNLFWGIYSTNGSLEVLGCHVTGSYGIAGIFIDDFNTKDRSPVPIIRDTVVDNCAMSCIFTAEPAIIRNCTLTGSQCGLTAPHYGDSGPGDFVLEGNRIFNNSMYGIQCISPLGSNVSCPENNTFDDGSGLMNRKGRLECQTEFTANAMDQWGSRLSNISLCWTDAFGDSGGETIFGSTHIYCTYYHIDNTGMRREHFPVTLVARKDGATCRTVVESPGEDVELILTIPPSIDIRILSVSPVPVRPHTRDFVRFNVTVTCTGGSALVSANYLVNGVENRAMTFGTITTNGSQSFMIGGFKVNASRYRVEVRLDPQNKVHETFEDNNNMTMDFVVAPPPTPPASFSAPLAGLSVLLLLVLMGVALSVFKGRRQKTRPPENGGI